MHKKRVTRLIGILRRISPDHFDIGSYDENLEKIYNQTRTEILNTLHTCDSTACALGYATVDKVFNAEGFDHARSTLSPRYITPFGTTKLGQQAAEEFFGISPEDTSNLFYPDYDADDNIYGVIQDEITPTMVADKLQELMDVS